MPELPPYKPPEAEPDRAIHLARMVLPQNPKPVRPASRLRVDVTDIEVPGLLDEHEPIARAGLALPGPSRPPRVIADGPSGLEVPWDHHPDLPALLLPGPAVAELKWRDRWPVAHFISPSAVGLPFSAQATASAAWNALAGTPHRRTVVTEVARLASQIDGLGHASEREQAFLLEMALPDDIEQAARRELGPSAPLLDPRCLRWILAELCVAWSTRKAVPPPEMDDEAEQVTSLLFPLLGRARIPFRRELYRALWCLHDSFALGQRAHEDADESAMAMLAMTSAHSVGTHLFGPIDGQLFRAAEMWAIDDNDPAIAGRDVIPSAIRSQFEQKTGTSIREFLGLALLATYGSQVTLRGNNDVLATIHGLQQAIAPGKGPTFLRAVERHMSLTPRQLGRQVAAEMARYDIPYRGWGTVLQHATEAMRDHPVMMLPGEMLPLGHRMFLDRAAELPRDIYARRHGLSRRRARSQIGHLFEARLQHRIERLRTRFWVATEGEIDRAVDRDARRPDAMIRDAGRRTYLVVEINATRLETGVASGHHGSVSKLMKTYLSKRTQADELIESATTVIGNLLGVDHASVGAAVPLVVTAEALPTTPAFEQEVRARRPDANPRFVCSVDEFERLLDLAEAGWDIAGLVLNWQAHGHGQMLGTFLRTQTEMTPRRSMAARFSASFVAAA